MTEKLRLVALAVSVFALWAAPGSSRAGEPPRAGKAPATTPQRFGDPQEVDNFTVTSARGEFKVTIEPDARVTRDMIHGARRDWRPPNFPDGARLAPGISNIRISRTGLLEGVLCSAGTAPILAYDLNPEGWTHHVILSGGTFESGNSRRAKAAVFARVLDSSNRERRRIILTDFDCFDMRMEDLRRP